MSDGIIRKTNVNGRVDPKRQRAERKLRDQDTGEQRWFAHVREFGIFNDAQAHLIADGLIDAQLYARAERDRALDDLIGTLRNWQDGIYEELDKMHEEQRTERERVAMLEGQIRAMMELKGVPGKQGERGEQGVPGEKGDAGPQGPNGEAAPHWIGVKIDGFDMTTFLSDGTLGPRISLKRMFEEFITPMAVGT